MTRYYCGVCQRETTLEMGIEGCPVCYWQAENARLRALLAEVAALPWWTLTEYEPLQQRIKEALGGER